MLVQKGGVINFKKIHRIRIIKPILLVKTNIHNSQVWTPPRSLQNLTFITCWSELAPGKPLSPRPYLGGHLAVVPRQPKVEPNLLFIASDLLKGRPDNCDQRASQSTATIKLEYKT